MSTSVADLVLGRVTGALDRAAPRVGGRALLGAAKALLPAWFETRFPGHGAEYWNRLVEGLNTPLPRVLVAGWRKYEAFLPYAGDAGQPGRAGHVDLVDQEIRAQWEIAPRLVDKDLSEPRIQVSLALRIAAGTVFVDKGRFQSLESGSLTYEGSVRIKDAPEPLLDFGPGQLPLPHGRLDFGAGWPIRPTWRSSQE